MSSQISEQWAGATVRFTNRWGVTGSGFLVHRRGGDERVRTFFVTNKDLIKRDLQKRADARYLILHLNVRLQDDSVVGKEFKCPLNDSVGRRLWREHDERDTDIYAADVTYLYDSHRGSITNKPVAYDLLASSELLDERKIGVGDDIMILGYPDAFSLGHPGDVNLPIVRQGIIATALDGVFEARTEIRGLPIVRRRRGFMIDVGTMRGSGGGPVVLKANAGDDSLPALLVGIVAETRFTMEESVKFSGLGFAFGSGLVRDTIDKFFA